MSGAQPGPRFNGLFRDVDNGQLEIWYGGTRVGHVTAAELQVDQALDVDGAADFAADVKFNLTITAGADGVGADGEQLTSGGAAAETDWAAAASERAMKNIVGERSDAQEVLQRILATPVYDFHYKSKEEATDGQRIVSTGDTQTLYTGPMAEEAEWAMHHNGRILNPVNALGYTIMAIKALNERIDELEK